MDSNTGPTVNDLQSILKQSFGNDIIVESYQVKDFLGPGENYGSKIVGVDAKIRRNKLSDVEDLHIIAKLPPPTQQQREMFDSPFTFKKEICMYSEILPAYKKSEIDCGISESEAYNNSPKFYGSRFSLNPEVDFDDDAAILLENLKVRGYYMVDRRIGCDLNHAKLTVTTLARFHALGIAIKHKNPEFFKVLKLKSKCLEFKDADEWLGIMQSILNGIKEDPVIGKFNDALAKVMHMGDAKAWLETPEEPWSTIIHADFWLNNFLFHKSVDGLPDDIKFIDFQNYLFLSPIRELAFFLGASTNLDVLTNHYDELVDLYYKVLIERLSLMNCDITIYSRDTFDDRLRKDSQIEAAHVICMLKIITMNVQDDNPDKHNVMNLLESTADSDGYLRRLRPYVKLLHERGLLDV